MTPTYFEQANIVAGLSKITSEKVYLGKNHKDFCNLHYIEIPYKVAYKFDLRDGDSNLALSPWQKSGNSYKKGGLEVKKSNQPLRTSPYFS
jgi:hypothetical protein